MSRTDAHRPYDVWMRDNRNRLIEIHDHADGVCDLPDAPEPRVRGCRWVPAEPAPNLCGCHLCTGKHWHRMDARRARQVTRLVLNNCAHGDDTYWEQAEVAILRAERRG